MKAWLKGGLIGAGVGLIIIAIPILLLLITGIKDEGAGLAFIALIISAPLVIISFATVTILLVLMVNRVKNLELTLTKKGFWIGIVFASIGFFYGISYIYPFSNFGVFNPFAYEGEFFLYTLLFVFFSIIGGTLIGLISEKIKNKSNWENWGYTKKGLIIGLVSSIIILIGSIIYIGYYIIKWAEDYGFNRAIEMATRFPDILIFILFIIFPLLICTIIGLIVSKIRSRK